MAEAENGEVMRGVCADDDEFAFFVTDGAGGRGDEGIVGDVGHVCSPGLEDNATEDCAWFAVTGGEGELAAAGAAVGGASEAGTMAAAFRRDELVGCGGLWRSGGWNENGERMMWRRRSFGFGRVARFRIRGLRSGRGGVVVVLVSDGCYC